MNQIHVVAGAGGVGSQVAQRLAARGVSVRVLSRSGSGPDHELIEKRSVDVADAEQLNAATADAAVIYNCVNPQYHRWSTDWPPLAANLLSAAERSGAVLTTTANLYGYGPVDGPMTEQTPLAAQYPKARVRIQMWQDALAAHEAGRVRAVEVRSSDYIGPGAEGYLGARAIPKVLAGKKISVLGSADQPHTWTYTGDTAAMLITAATDPRAWGRAWHTPSNPPRTQREALADMAEVAGLPEPKVGVLPQAVLSVIGLFNPMVRELKDVSYQLERPFIMDSSDAREAFGMAPTPWREVLLTTLRSYGFEG